MPAAARPAEVIARAGAPLAAPSHGRRTLLRYSLALAALLYLDRVCISQSLPTISAELGISKNDMGVVMMAFSLAYAIFEIPGGWLGDRIGPRAVITRIVVWWSAFTMATGLATGFYSLAGVRFMFGVGEAGCFPEPDQGVRQLVPRRGSDARAVADVAGRALGRRARAVAGRVSARHHDVASELLRLRRDRFLLGRSSSTAGSATSRPITPTSTPPNSR